MLASLAFLGATAGVALACGCWPLAAYAVSFWHYYLYWLAYCFGAVALDAFIRDAVLMKSAALVALGAAYLAAPPDPASLAVVAAGFLLNAVAARALGVDRTYYGHEVAGLPPRRVAAFPYSWVTHPMLVGNVLAFGGTLLNADFRQRWWPLACGHVAQNVGLLVMERYVTPRRRGGWLAGVGVAGSLLPLVSRGTPPEAALAMAALMAAYAGVLYWSSSRPTPSQDPQPDFQGGGTQ